MAPTVVLITGGNRGLGQGLVEKFLAGPNHTVIAANRDPDSSTSKALADLPKGKGSSLIVVKYEAAVEQDAFDIVTEIQQKHHIDHLDIVVANAGMMKSHPLIQEHFLINVLGVVSLYQATRSLLKESPNQPSFVPMGSAAGALGRQPPVPNATYGASKSVVNWYGVRINAEDEWLNSFIMDPGFVQTDMGNKGARAFGMEQAPTPVDESVSGMYQVLTTATKEKYGGKVVLFTGEVQDW